MIFFEQSEVRLLEIERDYLLREIARLQAQQSHKRGCRVYMEIYRMKQRIKKLEK